VLDKAEYSAFESMLNSSVVSYRIVSYMYVRRTPCLFHWHNLQLKSICIVSLTVPKICFVSAEV